MIDVMLVSAVVVAGVLVGVELCVAALAHPIADAMPADGALAFRSSAARRLGMVMPPWYVVTVVLTGMATVLLGSSTAGVLTGAAAALFAATVVLSVTVLVPINNRVKAWSQGEPPPDWRHQVRLWDRWHLVRVLLCVAALVLLTTAAVTAT